MNTARWLPVASLLLCACAGARGPNAGNAATEPEPDMNAKTPQDNPFVGAKLWVDPDSVARGLAKRWKNERPEDAALMAKLGEQPAAIWVGDWVPNVESFMTRQMRRMARGGHLPVFVLYNIPKRDCGAYSAGGVEDSAAYRKWISAVARGIGNGKAVILLEPDALPLLDKCLSPEDQKERLALIRWTVATFATLGNTYVYLDAGHSDWQPAPEMAKRLNAAGIANATGFSLNVSNYKWTKDLIAFGSQVSAQTGGKPFLIDTSRNGAGPPPAAGDSEGSWCNPDGRATGAPPTADTGNPIVHAFLWVKKPGESDGECNGGPKAGQWWTEMALGLAKRGAAAVNDPTSATAN